MKKLLFGIVFMMLNLLVMGANEVTLSGYIKDKETGEVLIGATAILKGKAIGCSANEYGYYSLTLPQGEYTIVFGYIGYGNLEQTINLDSDKKLSVKLTEQSEDLEEVKVSAERKDQNVTSPQMGVEKLQSKTIKMVPVLMGEVDPVKVIELLPGVKPTSEGSSGFSVRGGSPDQNLVLLDEAIVYNAGHLMGFFSVFNNDAIRDVKLYKGDIPAANGGRVASVLDVRMKDGNNQKFSGEGGIGLISSRLTLQGPVVNEKTSFLLSGRRSYMDLLLPFAVEESMKDAKIFFYDLNAKVNHTFNENNRLYLSGYFGRDVFDDGVGDVIAFGNKTATVRWNHVISPKLFSNLTFIASDYNYKLETGSDDGGSGVKWSSELVDYSGKFDFTYYATTNSTIDFGVQSIYHFVDQGTASGTISDGVSVSVEMPEAKSLESAIYLNNTHKIAPRLSARYGLRFSLFNNIGNGNVWKYDENHNAVGEEYLTRGEIYNTYYNFEPRVAATYLLTETSSLKASYSRTTQYMQMASNSTSGSPLDVWFSSSENIEPQICDQVAMGYSRNFSENSIETSAELFYKKMDNVIDFKDHASLLLNDKLEGDIRKGNGYAYGAELLFRITKEKYNGWISYTYSRAYRTVEEINDGKEFRSPYDRPHDISIVFSHKIGKYGSLSANWVFMSGIPMTVPVGKMMVGSNIEYDENGTPHEVGGTAVPIYSERNVERMPAYHRLDLAYTLKTRNKHNRPWVGEWNFSLYNAYGYHNAWMIDYIQDDDNPYKTKTQRVYLFSVVPSVSYNFKF